LSEIDSDQSSGRDFVLREESARAIVDQLIADTQLYNTAAQIKELLDFTARLRNIAPFNAMLLHIQKPGLSYAARAKEWKARFKRHIRKNARPLVILRNFGPVEFVYDILDTEGPDLPESAFSFPSAGTVPTHWMFEVQRNLHLKAIEITWMDHGDHSAGHAQCLHNYNDKNKFNIFGIGINQNHTAATQAVTLFHELAHIYLGHCGTDEKRGIKFNRPKDLALREIEAETVAYLVAKRTGLSPRSESYLKKYQGSFHELDLHRIMKVASALEKLLDLPFTKDRLF
jgi:hypothetical protein